MTRATQVDCLNPISGKRRRLDESGGNARLE